MPKRRTTLAPDLDARFDVPLRGVGVDAQTRCEHYGGPLDIVALRLGEAFYPCHACFEATAPAADRTRDLRAHPDDPAVLCGACRTVLTVQAYRASGHACPRCSAPFNPGCAAHYDLYFR
jgi:uncharacterized CHY-type Zn-finger protein